jgi:hypothetical protein
MRRHPEGKVNRPCKMLSAPFESEMPAPRIAIQWPDNAASIQMAMYSVLILPWFGDTQGHIYIRSFLTHKE